MSVIRFVDNRQTRTDGLMGAGGVGLQAREALGGRLLGLLPHLRKRMEGHRKIWRLA